MYRKTEIGVDCKLRNQILRPKKKRQSTKKFKDKQKSMKKGWILP